MALTIILPSNKKLPPLKTLKIILNFKLITTPIQTNMLFFLLILGYKETFQF